MKFSIIVPVYKVEKYIEKCIKSIINQTYKNFELIIVNDGSPDNSQQIIDKYVKLDKRITSYIKTNGGLSDARNYGLKYVKGDYILFIDSDDYINKDLLKCLNDEIKKNDIDVIRFRYDIINSKGEMGVPQHYFSNLDTIDAINLLLKDSVFETAWSYAYKTKFWKDNNFLFEFGKVHEDYGLIPYVILKSKKISSIDYIGYNYVIREGSIMTSSNIEKNKAKAMDVLEQFNININRIKITDEASKLIVSFLANGVFNISKILDTNSKKEYYKLIKKYRVYDYLIGNSLKRKIKKVYLKYKILLICCIV